jgi:hypothetical protein
VAMDRICGRYVSLCLGLVLLQGSIAWGQASSVIKTAPPLPPPSGSVIDVYNVTQFYSAITSTISGVTVMIHPGTYNLSSVPQLNKAGMTIRGSSGNRDDVVLVGSGMNTSSPGSQYGFQVNVSNITIADLTISGVFYHGIQVRGENGASNLLFHNLKILNAGERYIKGSTNNSSWTNDVTIEYCWLEQTQAMTGHSDNDYIGGIDAMYQNRWKVRDNVMKNIQGATGGGRGGIFLWNNVYDATVERNLVIGCDRGICMGNPSGPAVGTYHAINGVVRNNFVVRGADIAVELCKTNNLKVYNNTIYSDDSSYFRTLHVNGSVTTGLKFYSNILRGQVLYDSPATADTTGSIIGSAPLASWFVAPLNGDLRLTAGATAAINQGAVLAEVTDDYFALPRDSQPDKGAYEMPPPPPPHVTAVTPALAHVSYKDPPLTAITITFDKNVNIASGMVSVFGLNTGANTDFTLSYNLLNYTATLQWPAGLPNDTYQVTVSDAVTAAGVALDGEVNKLSPVLPSGNGTAGGSFICLIYRLVADTNEDRIVDVVDLLNLVATFGLVSGDPGFDATCDFNNDGGVDVVDLLTFVENFGDTIPQQ